MPACDCDELRDKLRSRVEFCRVCGEEALEFCRIAEAAEGKLEKIKTWAEAYPLDVFPEPDFKKAAEVLKQNGMTLDAISASNMRHVLDGIKAIIEA